MEQLRALLSNATGWFAQLSTREKRLVSITAAAVGLFVLFLIFAGFQSSANKHRRAIETGIQNATLGITVGSLIAEQAGALPPISLPSGVYGITMYLVTIPFVLWRRRMAG